MNSLKKINIEAVSLPDSWFQLIDSVLDNGREFVIDKGSYEGQTRLEFDWVTIHIEKPWLRDINGRPLVPEMPEGSSLVPPVKAEYISDTYWKYLMTDDRQPHEAYTYGERLCNVHTALSPPINQINYIINTYKDLGYRNNQMVLQIAQPSDLTLSDPPCLRHIDTRIQDGKLHFFPYFRSWDLFSGYPANLAGISYLQEYMSSEIGVEQGEMICSSKGLHLYGYAVKFAEMRTLKLMKAVSKA